MVTAEEAEWMLGKDTGLSSKTIWSVMVGIKNPEPRAPRDPADLGRCLRLLDTFPEWKPRIGEMAAKYPAWEGIIANWDEITALYYEELPSGTAPKCYAAMKRAEKAERATD